MFCLTVWNCHAKLEISFSQILDHDVKRSWMPIATLFFRDGVYWFVAVVGGSLFPHLELLLILLNHLSG
jgi:hypothetical protein